MARKKKDPTVKIMMRPGPYVRRIGGYEWSHKAGWTQDVDLNVAAELLTYPRPDFQLAAKPSGDARKGLAEIMGVSPESLVLPGDPVRLTPTLSEVAGRDNALILSAHGIGTLKALAGISDDAAERLLADTIIERSDLSAWLDRARTFYGGN